MKRLGKADQFPRLFPKGGPRRGTEDQEIENESHRSNRWLEPLIGHSLIVRANSLGQLRESEARSKWMIGSYSHRGSTAAATIPGGRKLVDLPTFCHPPIISGGESRQILLEGVNPVK
ncbi:hypothetical protein HPP92_006956 [Vanilla planifolia]|uniref:Uncharacterized protein n=1 Tax=Vanilla planifolia TaxID=51239 RepID=A0A835RGM0_VANPL|nr:hypothetical protein HPP92_006956 [Vanilla planifolia]